jgi:acyl dehydratase
MSRTAAADVRRFELPVDASLVLQFARAVGEQSPLLDDPAFATLALGGGYVPPPTILAAADHFDPGRPRRPEYGEAWPGSGVVGEGWRRPSGRGRGFHAEQTFEYRRHPRVGEVLAVEVRPGRQWAKPGRQGTMSFRETSYVYRDAAGEQVATGSWVSLAIQRDGGDGGDGGDRSRTGGAAAPVPDGPPEPSPPLERQHAGSVAVGTTWTHVVVGQLTLSQIVRYAGASGDFIAVHHDGRIARAAGYGDVFAHGMLTLALSARPVSLLAGTEHIRRLHGRMTAVVHPGDTLLTTVRVVGLEPRTGDGTELADLELETRTSEGTVALRGSATVALQPR